MESFQLSFYKNVEGLCDGKLLILVVMWVVARSFGVLCLFLEFSTLHELLIGVKKSRKSEEELEEH